MRFEKGTIQINQTQDIPLLEHVLRAGFITSEQLFQFLELAGTEPSRIAFTHRLARLVDHGLIEKYPGVTEAHQRVYCITREGEELLIHSGELFACQQTVEISGRSSIHCLELNELHLAVRKSGSLVHWIPASEIRSQNLTRNRYALDYDAVVVIRLDGLEFRFALEYEWAPRPKVRYAEIAKALESEGLVEVIVYAAANDHLVQLLAESLAVPNKTICVGLMQELRDQLLAAQVMVAGSASPRLPLVDTLQLCQRKPLETEPRPESWS